MGSTTFLHHNFATHKIKPGVLTAGTIKNNFKGAGERFVVRDNAFLLLSLFKGPPVYWKHFLFDD